MNPRKQTNSSAPKRTRRPKRVLCTALIPLDTAKIRKKLLADYQRRKKALEKLEAQLQQYNDSDEPEFQKFLARHFGAERTRIRELTEKIHLVQLRREKLRFMAREEGMSQGKYCAYLESKVTADADFWVVLENEIQEMQEELRRMDEDFERYCRECDETDGVAEDEETSSIDDEFEEDFDDSEEDFEEAFGKGAKSIFDRIFGDIFPEDEAPSEDDAKSLKKLYRELCFRYHPDKIGEHDAKTRRLWLSIQDAYETGNLVRLRAIHAGLEIESGKTELVCSDIDAMIGDVEWSIHMTKNSLREQKRSPFWGFTTWTEKRRQQAERELAEVFRHDMETAEYELRQYETELDRIRNSSRPKKKAMRPVRDEHPDWLQMDFRF